MAQKETKLSIVKEIHIHSHFLKIYVLGLTVIHTLGILASIKVLIWSFLNINTESHQSSTLICSFF